MPIKQAVTLDQALDLLNQATALDPKAMWDLVGSRVPCNGAMADHPTVQCGQGEGGPYTVGLLGILNGLFGTSDAGPRAGWGPLAMQYDPNHPEPWATLSFIRTPELDGKPLGSAD